MWISNTLYRTPCDPRDRLIPADEPVGSPLIDAYDFRVDINADLRCLKIYKRHPYQSPISKFKVTQCSSKLILFCFFDRIGALVHISLILLLFSYEFMRSPTIFKCKFHMISSHICVSPMHMNSYLWPHVICFYEANITCVTWS